MAQLLETEYPMPAMPTSNGDWDKWIKDSEKELEKIPADKLLKFPVADGYACYYVKSLRPLVLQHIPFLDNYYVPYAHIRGLREKDVERMISFEAMFS